MAEGDGYPNGNIARLSSLVATQRDVPALRGLGSASDNFIIHVPYISVSNPTD